MFQFPGFAFVSYVFRNKYLLLISASPKTFSADRPKADPARPPSELQISKVGFPIRKSSDQSLFAAPQGLSQRTTSFIASQRQGIHRILLRHLIALIINAHHSAEGAARPPCGVQTSASIERPVCFKHIRERRGQATPTCWLLAHGLLPGQRMYFLFTM